MKIAVFRTYFGLSCEVFKKKSTPLNSQTPLLGFSAPAQRWPGLLGEGGGVAPEVNGPPFPSQDQEWQKKQDDQRVYRNRREREQRQQQSEEQREERQKARPLPPTGSPALG